MNGSDSIRDYISGGFQAVFGKHLGLPATGDTLNSIQASLRTIIQDAIRIGADPAILRLGYLLFYEHGCLHFKMVARPGDLEAVAAWQQLFPGDNPLR